MTHGSERVNTYFTNEAENSHAIVPKSKQKVPPAIRYLLAVGELGGPLKNLVSEIQADSIRKDF